MNNIFLTLIKTAIDKNAITSISGTFGAANSESVSDLYYDYLKNLPNSNNLVTDKKEIQDKKLWKIYFGKIYEVFMDITENNYNVSEKKVNRLLEMDDSQLQDNVQTIYNQNKQDIISNNIFYKLINIDANLKIFLQFIFFNMLKVGHFTQETKKWPLEKQLACLFQIIALHLKVNPGLLETGSESKMILKPNLGKVSYTALAEKLNKQDNTKEDNKDTKLRTSSKLEKFIASFNPDNYPQEAVVRFENANYFGVWLDTWEMSKSCGIGSTWCISYEDTDSYFNSYNDRMQQLMIITMNKDLIEETVKQIKKLGVDKFFSNHDERQRLFEENPKIKWIKMVVDIDFDDLIIKYVYKNYEYIFKK